MRHVTHFVHAGQAAVAASEVAITTRALTMIFSNKTVPHLRTISGPDDLEVLLEKYKHEILKFTVGEGAASGSENYSLRGSRIHLGLNRALTAEKSAWRHFTL